MQRGGTSGTVNWALLQAEADKRNTKAQRDRLTDKYCRCGRLAECAWPLGKGRKIGRCLECHPPQGSVWGKNAIISFITLVVEKSMLKIKFMLP